jgi:hypothetical protein
MKRSPKSLRIAFSSKRLTHFGGLHLIAKVLSKNRFSFALISIYPLLSMQQSIHYSGRDADSNLSNRSGTWTDRNVPSPKTQWGLPIPHEITHLSQSHYPKMLPSPDGPVSLSQTQETPVKICLDFRETVQYPMVWECIGGEVHFFRFITQLLRKEERK